MAKEPQLHSEWWRLENRLARLEEYLNDGVSASKIARRLGTTKNAVIGKIHRLGLAARDWKPPLPRRYAFNEIGPASCVWPYGNPDKPDFHFCGASVEGIKPYCSEHMAIAWYKPKLAV